MLQLKSRMQFMRRSMLDLQFLARTDVFTWQLQALSIGLSGCESFSFR